MKAKRAILSVGMLIGLPLFLSSVAMAEPPAKPWEALLATMKASSVAYAKGANEIKKSAAFNDARTADKKLFADVGNTLTDWPGTLDALATAKGGGSLRLRVRIPVKKSGFAISFAEGFGFMDDGIPANSPVYAQAAEFAQGACVLFSGTVNPREDSTSEEGAMRAPEYKIKFTAIKPCK